MDTGADTTAVTNRVREDCALPAVGQAEHAVATAGGTTGSLEYGLRLALELSPVGDPSQPARFERFLKAMIAASFASDYDVLLGMDFLQHLLIVAWGGTMTIVADVD